MVLLRRVRTALRLWRTHGLPFVIDETLRQLRRAWGPPPASPPTAPMQLLTPSAGAAPLATPAVDASPPPPPTPGTAAGSTVPVRDLLRSRFAALAPLPVTLALGPTGRRVNVVTDSINAGSLFGGVGTALVLAALLARARGARLRLVTRTERAHAANLDAVLRLHGVPPPLEVEFVHCPPEGRRGLEAGPEELFLTTSWWTTESTLGSVPPQQVLYLLQEDERMFYPLGDDHLRCSAVLCDERLSLALNTTLLRDHFAATGVPGLGERAIAFEPAFPAHAPPPQPAATTPQGEASPPGARRRRLLFYARPNHPRNLFHFGLAVLDDALTSGLIDTSRWDVELFGVHIPPVRFTCGLVPVRHDGLAWADYAALMSRADLGLSLMDTPHPSYPPLDLAASGAVVLTNRFGVKTDLLRYSANIVCADLTPQAMRQGLAQATAMAEDDAGRRARHAAQTIGHDWAAALAAVVARHA
jgi:hypothetical protein